MNEHRSYLQRQHEKLTHQQSTSTLQMVSQNSLGIMEPQDPQEFILDVFADPASVRDVVRGMFYVFTSSTLLTFRGSFTANAPQAFAREAPLFLCECMHTDNIATAILHTIFFHRFFPSIAPHSREVLDITLPFVDDQELDTMIEKRTAELDRELSAERTHAPHPAGGGAAGGGGRGNISVQFFEKKRRKTWYMRAAYGGGDEEICWECWTVKVTVAEPRTESGESDPEAHHLPPRERGGAG